MLLAWETTECYCWFPDGYLRDIAASGEQLKFWMREEELATLWPVLKAGLAYCELLGPGPALIYMMDD